MRDSGQYVVTSLILISILILLSDIQYARADAIWTVGSQISEVAASGDNVYVLWQNNSPDQNVYFRRSTDGGVTFDQIINLSNAMSPGFGTSPKMAVSGNNVYVAWMNAATLGSNSTVLFRRSTDGGATFEDAQVLSTSKGESGIQQLYALDNNVYAVMIDYWTDENGYYYDSTFRMSRDNGKTFGDPISLLPARSYWNIGGVTSVAVSPSGDTIYAAGVDYGDCRPEQNIICDDNARIFFKRSTDGGSSFSEDITIERPSGIVTKSTSERRAIAPSWVQIAADNTHVGIVWGESPISPEQGSIFLALSSDRGETFETPVALDAGAKRGSDWPFLFSTSDSMYIAWNARQDDNSMLHIGMARINPDGSISKPINASGKISIPSWDAAASGDNLYVVGSNSTKNIGGLPDGVDVYFYESRDGGNSFEASVALSDDNAIKTLLAAQQKSLSFVNPILATSGRHVYVGWHTSYPDSHEIFIRASEDGGHTFGKMTSLNEATNDPISKGLAVMTSTSATYITIIVGIGTAAAVGALVVKHQRSKK